MNIVGVPDEWVKLIDTLVPDILKLVLQSWTKMPLLASDALEDPTTDELCKLLRQDRDSCTLPFQIQIQMVELNSDIDQDQGRMDIAFLPLIPSEEVYFCLECKRLNVVYPDKTVSYASAYVTNGMSRFISGQYSKCVKHGGMLGYVLNNDTTQAIRNVNTNIKNRMTELGMASPAVLEASSILPKNTNVKETHHTRTKGRGDLLIHHIFVPCS